ncbi:MAG: nitrite/sulfite reductase, partial [Deltaproteobacteria bacterium]|nr:nitrite/sulfite reductase [Deltaproteobacteria bacterium]
MEIRAEIEGMAQAIEAIRSGAISPEEFRRVRVIQGIYPIRGGTHRYLLRVRIPLGRPSPSQLRALADASDRFTSGRPVHLTTRQDVHIYGVTVRDIPEALTFLSERELTTREACGDTVRNIVVCPFAGIARDEPFDVSPFAKALGRSLLRNPVTQKLPRKFKIAFEGCEGADHVGLRLQDVGVRGVRSATGGTGFRVTLAGGLGSLPQAGIELEPFTPAGDLAATVEAVLRLFDRKGDRERRGRARLKFVAQSMGEVAFREAVFSERRSIGSPRSAQRIVLPEPVAHPPMSPSEGKPPGGWPGAFFQRVPGVVAVPMRIPLGDLSPKQLRVLADLVEEADATARFTPGQGVLLSDLPAGLVEKMAGRLWNEGFFPPSAVGLTRCAGAETCTVGTTGARSLAALLEKEVVSLSDFASSTGREILLGISGCANGCGRHMVADIGLQGMSRSVIESGEGADRKAPVYMLFLGGGPDGSGGVRFGSKVGRIPVRRVPEAVRRVLAVLRRDAIPGERVGETISRLGASPFLATLGELVEPHPESFSEEDFFDLGIPDP